MVQKLGRTKRVLKVGKTSAKDEILKVQDNQQSHRGNKTNRSLEIKPRQIEVEARGLKVAKTQKRKLIEKETELSSYIGGKIYLTFLQVKHQEVIKIKNRDRMIKKYG